MKIYYFADWNKPDRTAKNQSRVAYLCFVIALRLPAESTNELRFHFLP